MIRSLVKTLAGASVALSLMVVGCTGNKGSSYDKLKTSYDSLLMQSDKNQADLNEAIGIINEVEGNLSQIADAEHRVQADALKGELNQSQKQRIMDEISLLRQTLQENKQNLAQQQEKLKRSGINIAALDKKISLLTSQIAEKDQMIQSLQADLESARGMIARQDSLISEQSERGAVNEATIAIQNKRLQDQDAALHRAYYCFGTLSELKEENIIKGGGLFSKAKVLPEGFNQEYFKQVDTRDLTTIALFAAKAHLRTQHPASSYHFEKDADGNQTLVIDNQKDFWSRSKYLVVEVE
ncbi:hypothetical protein [Porphyromonas sp. HMSC065F10]|uniref:Cbp1 family collagen-binding glycoprotein adhesin n=1 Tax=Porphyromonas sp. HMSC065F10 TaxID=1739394 RepID=UPI0008BF8C5E|nr:hypothetical protein [Porphyromonas sp. HMSC065F10]OFR33235.1 hypothetical protein HMPREF2890_07795 [Porphyromonas sp. HMSC065F10]